MSGSSHLLACHFSFGDEGNLAVVELKNGAFQVHPVPCSSATHLPPDHRPVYLHADKQRCYLLDPVAMRIITENAIPSDAPAGYAYFPPDQQTVWLVNDGDEDTGIAPLHCGQLGSPVTVLHNGVPRLLKNVCLGKGHHVPAFSMPSTRHPAMPRRAFVSNLLDGSLSVLDNDPASDRYLDVLHLINLADPAREKDGAGGIPNNAFPHGMVFSPRSGKVYSLNNGYGTVNVIDPITLQITDTIAMRSCSNLCLSPDGRYLIGKGADRKSNPDHVIGRVTVVDTDHLDNISELDLPDIYPSTFKFNAEGNTFYLTTASTGSAAQKQNIKISQLLVFHLDNGKPKLDAALDTGAADCGRRPIALFMENGKTRYIFNPNISDGTLSVFDATNLHLMDTLAITGKGAKEMTFSFWPNGFFGT